MRSGFSASFRQDGTALLAGAALPFAFAPFGVFPVAWFSLALLFALLPSCGWRAGFRRGFAFGLGAFGVGVSWVYVAIHDFGYTAAPIAAGLTLLFVAVLALYMGLFGLAAAWVLGRVSPLAGGLIALPALWVLVEWFRGWFLSGFPWLSVGYSQIDTPLAGYAPVLGIYGLALLTAFTAAAGAALWRTRSKATWLAALVALSIWLGGGLLGAVAWTQPEGKPIRVALVQGNQPQLDTWDPSAIAQRLKVYADLSRVRFGATDLVVWPENAVTLFYQDLEQEFFAPLAEEARATGTDLVLGVPLIDGDGERYYTTMMSLGSSSGFYRKSHLVPFGEFVPLEGLMRGLIGFFDLPMSSFTAGPVLQPPLAVAGVLAGVSICYEDAFGAEVLRALPAATVLVNGSNNAWYGDSLAPHQHLQISRMRALETGRPLLRATTNGISALVDHRGQVLARSPQFEMAVVEGEVQPMAGATPYVRLGDWPALFVSGFLLLLAFRFRSV